MSPISSVLLLLLVDDSGLLLKMRWGLLVDDSGLRWGLLLVHDGLRRRDGSRMDGSSGDHGRRSSGGRPAVQRAKVDAGKAAAARHEPRNGAAIFLLPSVNDDG